ncbi:MAG: hypothetical protein AB1Z21_12005, partial [Synechococcaceae cyanobacterium]
MVSSPAASEASTSADGSAKAAAEPDPTPSPVEELTALETAAAAMQAAVHEPTPRLSAGAAGGGELADFIEASGLLAYDPAAITRIY